MAQIEGAEFVEIPCWEIGEIDGEKMQPSSTLTTRSQRRESLTFPFALCFPTIRKGSRVKMR